MTTAPATAPQPISLLIALIDYAAKPDAVAVTSLASLLMTLRASGVQFGWLMRTQEADLCRTRNGLAAETLAGPYTHLLTLDGDVGYKPEDVIALLQHNVDYVSGVYPRRDDSGAFTFRHRPGAHIRLNPHTREPSDTGLLDVLTAPAGFTLIKRECLDKMVEAYPDRWYNDVAITGGKAWSFWEFTPNFVERERISEDYTFCRMWREIGGTVWVDPDLRLTHVGRKSWTGRLADKLKIEQVGTVPVEFLKSLGPLASDPVHTAHTLAATLDTPWGQQNRDEMTWLLNKMRGAKSVLEIGSCFGRNLEHFASVMAPGALIRAIDLGRSDEYLPGIDTVKPLHSVIAKLKARGFDADVLIADSHLPSAVRAASKCAPYDLVFIDGDHTEAGVLKDWKDYGPMGRMVAFHDIAAPHVPGVAKAWDAVKTSGKRTEEKVESNMGIGVVHQ